MSWAVWETGLDTEVHPFVHFLCLALSPREVTDEKPKGSDDSKSNDWPAS
jgi:hypothetical protein